MTEDELNVIVARADAATPGPWEVHETGHGYSDAEDSDGVYSRGIGRRVAAARDSTRRVRPEHVESLNKGDDVELFDSNDADFIAHARADIPALVARVEELEADLGELATQNRDICDNHNAIRARLVELNAERVNAANLGIECTRLSACVAELDASGARGLDREVRLAARLGDVDARIAELEAAQIPRPMSEAPMYGRPILHWHGKWEQIGPGSVPSSWDEGVWLPCPPDPEVKP